MSVIRIISFKEFRSHHFDLNEESPQILSFIAFITTKNKLLLQKKYDTAKGNISNHIDKGFYFLNEFADNKFCKTLRV